MRVRSLDENESKSGSAGQNPHITHRTDCEFYKLKYFRAYLIKYVVSQPPTFPYNMPDNCLASL